MSETRTILAIDPSSTCCGAAVFAHGKLVDAWRVTPDRTRDDDRTRVTAMIAELEEILHEHDPAVVVIEQPLPVAMPGRHKANAIMQRAYGRIMQAFLDAGCEVVEVPVNVWTRGRSKRNRASVLVGHDAEKDKGLDGADAIGLGRWFLASPRATEVA